MAGALLNAVEVFFDRLEAISQLLVAEKVDFLLGEVDGGLDVSAQVDDRLGEAMNHGRELALQ